MTIRCENIGRCAAFFILAAALIAPWAQSGEGQGWSEQRFPGQVELRVRDGFKLEQILSQPYGKASWICIATDPQGRFVIADEGGALYRLALKDNTVGALVPLKIPAFDPKSGKKLGELGFVQGFCFCAGNMYAMVNGHPDMPMGLYRALVKNGDYERAELLTAFEGGGEHGPHAILLGPDQQLYVVAGNDSGLPQLAHSHLPLSWGGDQLLAPDMQEQELHTKNGRVPGGWVCQVDPDGKNWRVIAAGMRNAYDIAFNADGELFTADSDDESQLGLPWYRPPRVYHVRRGADFGWRSLDYAWPEYFPDGNGPIARFSRGSPSGVFFATGAQVPSRYQHALFVLDWAAGRVNAVQLAPQGASYTGKVETIVEGRPFAAVDACIGSDGAVYIITGGRGAQTHLYRLAAADGVETKAAYQANEDAYTSRELRRKLEGLQRPGDLSDIETIWPHLHDADPAVRTAARVALEHQPLKHWKARLLGEANPERRVSATLAFVRTAKTDDPDVIKPLATLKWEQLSTRGKLELLRAHSIRFARFDLPKTGHKLERLLDDNIVRDAELPVRMELARLLAYFEGEHAVEALLRLFKQAAHTTEQLHLAQSLSCLGDGWTDARRAEFLRLCRAIDLRQCGYHTHALLDTWAESVSGQAVTALKTNGSALPATPEALNVAHRPAKEWTLADLQPALERGLAGRDFERGAAAFKSANCISCHVFGNTGSDLGPDLTLSGNRFSATQLLESTLDPNKVIPDRYRSRILKLASGHTINGIVVGETDKELLVVANPQQAAEPDEIPKQDIVSNKPCKTSLMPEQLLARFTEDEILDLLAYLIAGGNRDDKLFKK